jgi:hypothetical protein
MVLLVVSSQRTNKRLSFLGSLCFILDDTHGNSLSVVSLVFLLGSLDSSSISLLFMFLFEDLLLLHLVDGFNKNGLVFELVTLSSKVEMMINVGADFLGFSIFSKKSSEDSLSSHPEDLGWHSSVSGTLSFTHTSMSTYLNKNGR